jgi:hypothetical protein
MGFLLAAAASSGFVISGLTFNRTPVTESEYDEVMMLMAQESEAQAGFGNWSDEDQRLWEAEQERLKKWTAKYSPIDDGDSYAGIAV